MNRRRKIYEGKAKVLYEGPEPGTLVQYFKDDATAGNGAKHDVIDGKGVLNNRISEFIFTRLNGLGIPTHFIRRMNMREQLIKEVEIIPIEVVVRNVAAGSLVKRLGLEQGTQLPRSIIEFYYKDDALGDPLVSEEHITAFGWATPPELDDIVLRALSRDRDDRYATARDLGRDLSRALGRLGDAVDRAEVAEWLEQLFPEGRRQHSILVESARWGEAEPTERSDPGPVSEVVSRSTWSGVASSDALANPADVTIDEEPPPPAAYASGPMPVLSSPAPALPPPARRSSAIGWIALGAFGVVIMAVTVIVLVQLMGPAPVTTTVLPADPSRVGAVAADPVVLEPAVEPVEQAPVEQAGLEQAGSEPAIEQAALEAEVPGETPGEPARTPARSKRTPRDRGRPAQSGSGTVVVSTPGGWANVYGANGRFLGETPLTTTLPEGTHRLTLRPYGQPPSHAVSVTVRSGETARVPHRR